jgi:hypothetical protein
LEGLVLDEEVSRLALGFTLGVKGLGGVLSIRLRTSSSLGALDMAGIDPSKPFVQARLKHKWAHKHIHELQVRWDRFLQTDFCRVEIKDNADGSQSLQLVTVKNAPVELAMVLGDAIHSFRCALDHTISEILGWKDTRLTFPMGEDREELVSSFRTEPEVVGNRTLKKGRNAAIELAVPGIGKFIVDEIAPYKAANGFLWPLNKLDGTDKHRLITPVVVPQTIEGVSAVDKNNNRVQSMTATLDGSGRFGLCHFGQGGVKIESYGKATAEIFFDEPGVIQGQPVFPTLIQISEAVAQTIDRIEEFVLSAGWVCPSEPRTKFVP